MSKKLVFKYQYYNFNNNTFFWGMNLNNNIKIVIIVKIDDIHKLESVNIDNNNNTTYRSTYFEYILEFLVMCSVGPSRGVQRMG